LVAKPTHCQFRSQPPQRQATGSVQLERLSDQWRLGRIEDFGFTSTPIGVAQGRWPWVETLFEPTIEPLAALFAKVALVVDANDAPTTSCQAPTGRATVEILVGEEDVNTAIEKFANVRPVPPVP